MKHYSERIPLSVESDHLTISLSPGPWLLDTGSPVSISNELAFFMGRNRETRRCYGHANVESLRVQTGVNAVGLLGNDHFATVDALLNLPERFVTLSTDWIRTEGFCEFALSPVGGTGVNTVDVDIAGLGIRPMILDTGAKYSYLDTLEGAHSRSRSAAKDFMFTKFGLEQLDVELHEIDVRLGSINGIVRCASHRSVTHRLNGTGAVGILGWDILKYGQVSHCPRKGLIFTKQTE